MEDRRLKRWNVAVTLQVVDHGTAEAPRTYLFETEDSVALDKLTKRIKERLGYRDKPVILWLDPHGNTVDLDSQREMIQFVNNEWCTQPWVLHVYERTKGAETTLSLHDVAQNMFFRYDTDASGTIDRRELSSMMHALDKTYINTSQQLVDKFIEFEFRANDKDGSGALDMNEFVDYVNSMTSWMRVQLLEECSFPRVFASLTSQLVCIPRHMVDIDYRSAVGGIATVHAPKHRIFVEVPASVPQGKKQLRTISISSLSSEAADDLKTPGAQQLGEFAFSPVVRIATADDLVGRKKKRREHDVASADEPLLFPAPVTVAMPHAFDAEYWKEGLRMLWCPEGKSHWELYPADSIGRDAIIVDGDMLFVKVPGPGVVGAYSNPDVDEQIMVSVIVMGAPKLRKERVSTIRVYLCPAVSECEEKLMLADSAEWGLVHELGRSPPLSLVQGAAFSIRLGRERIPIAWEGVRRCANFAYTPPRKALLGSSWQEELVVDIMERATGPGVHAHSAKAVAS
eukprot:1332463-Prymnesium_polylepis.1